MSDVAEIVERLNRLAKPIGRMIGIEIEVDEHGDRLVFINSDGDEIMRDGEEIIAATPEEIANKNFLDDFAVRAFRAAMIAKYQEIERSRTP